MRGLAEGISSEEAARLASVALETSRELAAGYGASRPAWLHNMLVNSRLRHRGLCWHYAEDLQARLDQERFATLVLQRGVAHLSTPQEHNSVVVTGHGQPFSQGLVLDAWRNAGRLVWAPVASDRYPWELRPPSPGSGRTGN